MPTSPDPALRFEGVVVTFERRSVLEGVEGALAPGGSLALIGPNGAGKTTLIRAVLGLIPLASGRIQVLGTSPSQARGRVAYVPQAEALDPEFPISAFQVVLMGRYRRIGWLRRPARHDKGAAAAALDQVGLLDRAGDRFGVLSGGQRQRVLLARALAQEPDLLLLDEPFNGLDTITTELLIDVLREQRTHGVAVVMSTHDLSVARVVCDEACLLNRRQVAIGSIAAVLTPELLRDTYGGRAFVMPGGSTIVTTR